RYGTAMSDHVDHAPTDHAPAERGPLASRTARSWSLPVAVWIAPVAWFVHLSAGMILGPAACEWGSELPLHLLSAGCIAAALVGGTLLLRYRTEDAATRFVARMG